MYTTFYDDYKKLFNLNDKKNPKQKKYLEYVESILSIHHGYYPPLIIEQLRFVFLENFRYNKVRNAESFNDPFREVFNETYNLLTVRDISSPAEKGDKNANALLECAPINDVVASIVELFKVIFKTIPQFSEYKICEVDFQNHEIDVDCEIPNGQFYLDAAEKIKTVSADVTPKEYAVLQTTFPNIEVLDKIKKYEDLSIMELSDVIDSELKKSRKSSRSRKLDKTTRKTIIQTKIKELKDEYTRADIYYEEIFKKLAQKYGINYEDYAQSGGNSRKTKLKNKLNKKSNIMKFHRKLTHLKI
jgi:hypothetical protein